MMYQIGETVWAIIYPFDAPKKCVVTDITLIGDKPHLTDIKYTIACKNREYVIRNIDVYPNKIDAEIFWALCMKQDYEHTLQHTDMFLTDDYERGNRLATQILAKYAEDLPHLLIKYL